MKESVPDSGVVLEGVKFPAGAFIFPIPSIEKNSVPFSRKEYIC
jgi:hypothetical protein